MDPTRPPPESSPSPSTGPEKSTGVPFSQGDEERRDPPGAVGSQAEPQDVEPDPRMVDYVRRVTSLIEGRRVSRAEVIEMLERTRRQHSLARERRTEYVLRRLEEEPEKPP
jgi:hypothetical protein